MAGSRDEDWRSRAACLEEDPELFFPIGNTGPALLQIEHAKAVCRRCPVTDTCREWALASRTDDGVWGGLSEDERKTERVRRQRRASLERARLLAAAADQEASTGVPGRLSAALSA